MYTGVTLAVRPSPFILARLAGMSLMDFQQEQGRKIPCPYCDGKGHNEDANAECGFCTDGIHTIGE